MQWFIHLFLLIHELIQGHQYYSLKPNLYAAGMDVFFLEIACQCSFYLLIQVFVWTNMNILGGGGEFLMHCLIFIFIIFFCVCDHSTSFLIIS